jgi:hypothetical protein
MTDELVRNLQRDWQSQQYDSGRILRKLRRHRWTPHLVLGFEILGCVIALGAGIWFARVAAIQPEHQLLLTLSAVVMLVAAPLLGIAIVMARRPGLAWHSETPESILRIGILRADATLRAMRVGRWHIGIVAGFVAVLWLLQWLGYIDAEGFLILYTAVCLAASLGSWLWMRWRSRAVLVERAACNRLLAELRADHEGDAPDS